MKYYLLTLTFCFVAFFAQSTFAKKKEVKGRVTTFHKIPLQKVSIVSKSMTSEILSDENGCFSFTCDEKEKITFEANGFFSKTSNNSSIVLPKAFSMMSCAFLLENGGTASCSNSSSSAISSGNKSRRVDSIWPNLIKTGPRSSSARRIRAPRGALFGRNQFQGKM